MKLISSYFRDPRYTHRSSSLPYEHALFNAPPCLAVALLGLEIFTLVTSGLNGHHIRIQRVEFGKFPGCPGISIQRNAFYMCLVQGYEPTYPETTYPGTAYPVIAYPVPTRMETEKPGASAKGPKSQ